jgi:methionyl-tRNA synthetase
LVAILGNFINRVVVLTHKYYDGVVPEYTGNYEELEKVKHFPNVIGSSVERFRFREASQELMNLARLGNQFLQANEPWKKIKEDPETVKGIMYVALQIASAIAVLSEPFLPFTSKKLKGILDLDTGLTWNDITTKDVLLPEGHTINKAELLFSKIDDKVNQAQLDKLEATRKANEAANKEIVPQKETATFDDFTKLDLRVGTIIEAEKVRKTKKLLKLVVDTGLDKRTIVSGIALSFTPEEVIGKKVTVLANLAPRVIAKVESQGMILMTETPEGKLVFVNPDEDGVRNGETIS